MTPLLAQHYHIIQPMLQAVLRNSSTSTSTSISEVEVPALKIVLVQLLFYFSFYYCSNIAWTPFAQPLILGIHECLNVDISAIQPQIPVHEDVSRVDLTLGTRFDRQPCTLVILTLMLVCGTSMGR